MNQYRKYIIIFLLIPIIFFVVLEYFYINFPIPTNASEQRIVEIQHIKNQHIKYAIFGSSVTNGVLGSNPNIYNNVYNGTTAGATTLLGQYFLSKRLLDNNNKVDKIFLSFTPHMLSFDVTNKKNKRVVRFLNNSFTNNYEKMTLKSIDKKYQINDSFIINRRFYISNLISKRKLFFNNDGMQRNLSNVLNKKVNICSSSNNKQIKTQIANHANNIYKSKLNYHILKLMSLIDNDQYIIIIEPMPKTVYNEFIQSRLYNEFIKLLEDYGIKYYDSNTLYSFKDCMFRDQLHLKKEFTLLYEKIIIRDYLNLR